MNNAYLNGYLEGYMSKEAVGTPDIRITPEDLGIHEGPIRITNKDLGIADDLASQIKIKPGGSWPQPLSPQIKVKPGGWENVTQTDRMAAARQFPKNPSTGSKISITPEDLGIHKGPIKLSYDDLGMKTPSTTDDLASMIKVKDAPPPIGSMPVDESLAKQIKLKGGNWNTPATTPPPMPKAGPLRDRVSKVVGNKGQVMPMLKKLSPYLAAGDVARGFLTPQDSFKRYNDAIKQMYHGSWGLGNTEYGKWAENNPEAYDAMKTRELADSSLAGVLWRKTGGKLTDWWARKNFGKLGGLTNAILEVPSNIGASVGQYVMPDPTKAVYPTQAEMNKAYADYAKRKGAKAKLTRPPSVTR